METQGTALAEALEQKAAQVRQACAGLDEATAARTPPGEGRWSARQVISHLCGPEGTGHTPGLRRFLEEETPLLDLRPGDPFETAGRQNESLEELLADLDAEFRRMAAFVRPLTDEQLGRRARIPMLKGSPLGETPTLGQWVGAIAEFHVGFHLDQLGTIRGEVS